MHEVCDAAWLAAAACGVGSHHLVGSPTRAGRRRPTDGSFGASQLRPHRRKGFRGWAASMLPPAPPSTRRPTISVSARRAWTEVLGVFAMFFLASVLAAVFDDAHQPIRHDTISVAEGVLSGVSELAIAAMAIVVVGSLTRLRGLSFADIGWAPCVGQAPRITDGKRSACP